MWLMAIAIIILAVIVLLMHGLHQGQLNQMWRMFDQQRQINEKFYFDLKELKENQNTIRIELPEGATPA